MVHVVDLAPYRARYQRAQCAVELIPGGAPDYIARDQEHGAGNPLPKPFCIGLQATDFLPHGCKLSLELLEPAHAFFPLGATLTRAIRMYGRRPSLPLTITVLMVNFILSLLSFVYLLCYSGPPG